VLLCQLPLRALTEKTSWGLVDDIKEYPDYNCFEDAIHGKARQFRVVKWKEYNDARRWNPSVDIEKFTELCTLKYDRLPGYEDLSQAQYVSMMRRKLKERTAEVLKDRDGKPSLGADRLKKIKPGASPKNTRTSGLLDHRPRVLSKDPERRSLGEKWYFSIYFKHQEASRRYRSGETDVEFPKGTYKPPLFTVAFCGGIS
jgi:hypothetical protein